MLLRDTMVPEVDFTKLLNSQIFKSLQYAFRDRKNKKRVFRSLWISRISAGLGPLGINYSRFINLLKNANVELDRKVLAGIAYSDPDTFGKIVDKVRV